MVNTTTSDSVPSGAEGRVGSNRSCEKKITVWSRVQLPLHLDTCRNVLRIETMGGLRKWHVRNLPCTTVDDAVYSKSPPTTTPCPGRKSRPGFWRKAHGCNAEVLSMGEWWTIKQPWKGCAVVKPGEAGGMCLDATRRAQRPIDLRYHAIAPAGQGTCSIPRHNHLQGSRKGDHWTISYKRSRGVLRIETMGDSRERHVRNLPCPTIFDVVYRSHSFRKSDEGSGCSHL